MVTGRRQRTFEHMLGGEPVSAQVVPRPEPPAAGARADGQLRLHQVWDHGLLIVSHLRHGHTTCLHFLRTFVAVKLGGTTPGERDAEGKAQTAAPLGTVGIIR